MRVIRYKRIAVTIFIGICLFGGYISWHSFKQLELFYIGETERIIDEIRQASLRVATDEVFLEIDLANYENLSQIKSVGKRTGLLLSLRVMLLLGGTSVLALYLDSLVEYFHFRETINRLNLEQTEDSLTGASSWERGNAELRKAFACYQSSGVSPTILFLFPTQYREIAESSGYSLADQFLKHVVTTLSANVRHTDQIIRWEYAELIMILPGVTAEQAKSVIKKLRVAVALRKFALPERMIEPLIVLGVSWFLPDDPDHLAALDRAKNNAKGIV